MHPSTFEKVQKVADTPADILQHLTIFEKAVVEVCRELVNERGDAT